MEADLIEANAPYSLDWQVQTRMHEQRWLLRFLVRTSRILGTTEFTTGSETTKIWRVTRIDNLSLVDLTHGVARNGFGRVYVEQIRGLVANRLLPALSSEGQLRNLFSKPRKELDVIALMFRLYHAETFPKGLRSALPVVAKLAHERRLLLEEVHQTLKRADGGLISPTEFFLSEESHRSIARGMRQLGRADLAARLARFSLATDLDEDTQQKIREVSHFLFEQAVREVERHEAWHILVPEPQRTGEPPWPEEADNEGIAYLGMVADADDEIALCSDTLYRLFLGAKKEEHPSATDTVVYGLWLRMLARDLEVAQAKKESETADTAAAEGKEASSIFSVWKRFLETAKTKYASRKTMCRELLQEWYGESRSLKWIGHTPREIQYMPLGNTRT